MPVFKPLPKTFIPEALVKAKHYRLLNEPRIAESICLDILGVDPDHQEALVVVVLSISDLLERRKNEGVRQARQHIERIGDAYQRAYFNGLLCERRGLAVLRACEHFHQHHAFNWFMEALEHYAEAEKLRPENNSDVILRWNTICRIFEAYPNLGPMPDEEPHAGEMLE